MNRERIQLWVQALRSGEYVQGTGALEYQSYPNGNAQEAVKTHCCLGVACRVAIDGGLDVKFRNFAGTTEFLCEDRGLGSVWTSGRMPEQVAEWFGLPMLTETSTDVILEDGVTATAANDKLWWSFNEIAETLEKEYLS